MSAEKMLFSCISAIMQPGKLQQPVRVERISNHCAIEVERQTDLFRRLLDMIVHLYHLIATHPLNLGKIVVRVEAGLRFQAGIKLKAVPHNLYGILIGKRFQGFFELSLADVTKRATDIGPDVYSHAHNIMA